MKINTMERTDNEISMVKEPLADLQSSCRLCGSSTSTVVKLFSEESCFTDLSTNINLYLPVKVQPDDGFSGHCCWSCTSIVMSWHNLYLTCLKKQKMYQQILDNSPLEQHEVNIKPELVKEEHEDLEEECLHQSSEEPQSNEESSEQMELEEESTSEGTIKLVDVSAILKDAVRITCNICHKIYKTHRARDSHIKVVHENGEINKFPCEVCGFLCERGQMQQHLAQHSDEKPFACEVCGKCFKQRKLVNKHMAIHTDLRLFQCKLCPKSFKTKWNLRNHQSVHSDTRPFVCQLCSKAFYRNWDLQQHCKFRHKIL